MDGSAGGCDMVDGGSGGWPRAGAVQPSSTAHERDGALALSAPVVVPCSLLWGFSVV